MCLKFVSICGQYNNHRKHVEHATGSFEKMRQGFQAVYRRSVEVVTCLVIPGNSHMSI